MSKLAEAFRELTQVCRVRPGAIEADIAAMARRLFRVMGEYPEAVALAAMDEWPRRSAFFPTEHEIRGLLEEIAGALARRVDPGNLQDGTYSSPVGATAEFARRVHAAHGAAYVDSWLIGGLNCLFSHDTIYTTAVGRQHLLQECGGIAGDCGVKIIQTEQMRERLREYARERGWDEGKRRKWS